MKEFGVYIGIWSVGSSYFLWTKDWWRPITFTGTLVGIEDFITGFAVGGVLIAGYEFFFRKQLKDSENYSNGWESSRKVLTIFLGAFFLTYTLARFPSWLAWTISSAAGAITLVYFRRDLLKASLGTGLIAFALSTIIYQAMILINPQFVRQTYLMDQLSGLMFLGIPIEEYVWFFTSGCLFGPYYELYHEKKLEDL